MAKNKRSQQSIDDGIPASLKQSIIEVLSAHPHVEEIYLTGERARGEYHAQSDIQLLLKGEKLTEDDLDELREKLEGVECEWHVEIELLTNEGTLINSNQPATQFFRMHEYQFQTKTLKDIGKILTGKTPSTKNPENFGGRIPFVTPRDFTGSRFIEVTERYLTEKGASTVKSSQIPNKSVMVTCIGSDMGKVALSSTICITNQQINSIAVNRNYSPDFIYYNLSQRKLEIRNSASGSAQPIVNKSQFSQMKINLPPLKIQRAIAHILGSLDDKIELNRKINKTLEAMAQAIFKSWFIDFDPVVWKAVQAGKDVPEQFHKTAQRYREQPERMTLNAETLDLFPDEFVESELGWVPRGWEVAALSAAFEINPQRKLQRNQPARCFDMKCLPTMGMRPRGETIRNFTSGMKFKNGDTIVARITPCLENGKTAFINFLNQGEVAWGSTEYIVLSALKPIPASLSYFLARSTRFREFAITNMTGSSGRQRVSAKVVAEFPIVKAPTGIYLKFGKLVESHVGQITKLDDEYFTLAALRDILLPKLISGELRIKDVDKILEEVK